jgi:hypothetical protein
MSWASSMRGRWGVGLVLVLAFARWTASAATADEADPEPEHLLEAVGGLGFTFSHVEEDGDKAAGATGVFLEAEHVFWPGRFFSPRFYGGALATFPDEDSCGISPCDVQSKVALFGAKFRLMAPIPYVGPFIELGLGASLGHLRTLDVGLDEETNGAALHIPWALGLAFGRHHSVSVAVSYLTHLSQHQTSGALAVGVGIPLP